MQLPAPFVSVSNFVLHDSRDMHNNKRQKLFWIIIVIAHLRDNIVLLKGKAKYILVILLLTIPAE